jgi:hypothetical protein
MVPDLDFRMQMEKSGFRLAKAEVRMVDRIGMYRFQEEDTLMFTQGEK